MSKVYIVILNYKNWQDSIECLESLYNLNYNNFNVFVIDNDSKNNSLSFISQWALTKQPNVNFHNQGSIASSFCTYLSKQEFEKINLKDISWLTLIQNNENKGFASGNNIALRKLMDENAYLWLLNPDMVVEFETLNNLVKFASENDFNSIIGTSIKSYYNKDIIHALGGAKINYYTGTIKMIINEDELAHLDYICGGSLFVHISHFKEVGLLPEQYFLYWEETDWCFRAKQLGYQFLVCINAVCFDKISTSIGKSYLADYYYTRNGLLFIDKFKRSKLKYALIFSLFRLSKRLLKGQIQRAKGVYEGINSFFKLRRNETQ